MPTKPPTPCRRCGAKATYRGLCPDHAKQAERQRGTTTQRGYGTNHKALRAHWAPLVATGTVTCARCGELIAPDSAWDLGHNDLDRSRYNGPEHAAHNRATNAGRGDR